MRCTAAPLTIPRKRKRGEGCVSINVCVMTGGLNRGKEKEKDLDSRANGVQREEGGTVGGTRVTVTAAAFERRGTLGGRRTKKTRTKTC